MDSNQRGDLFLDKVPNKKVEEKILSHLLSLRQNSSLEVLGPKIKKAPTVLFKDISARRGLTIAGELQELGASVVFVPYPDEEPSVTQPQSSSADSSSSHQSKKSRVAPFSRKSKKRKWARIVLLLILLFISLFLLVLKYYFF